MFLRPHHLQHSDIYADERLHYHLQTLDPFHWGIRELQIDEEALTDHQLVVHRLDAVLPGGCILRYPGNCVIEAREFESSAERLDVHLGIRHLSDTEANSAPKGNGARDVRYIIESDELPDMARGGFESPIELVHPNVRLFVTGEEHSLELHESFKIAEVHATGELKNPFALSPTYAPPLLAVQAAPLLLEEIMKIVSQIAGRIRVVSGRHATYGTADLEKLWMRYTLARNTPYLRHLLSTGETRPFQLYSALVECAGALAAFQLTEPAELPIYDHNDLYGCFHGLIEFLDSHLGGAIPDRFKRLDMPFDLAHKAYVTTELTVEYVDPRNQYYLAIKADIDSKELASMVVEHGKASSVKGVQTLVMLNVSGLRMEHLPGMPTEIDGRPDHEYFKVEPHGTQWKKVSEEFSCAFNLGKLENANVSLYVVTPGD
jgi:type VI secretion system protein ImpJ